MCKEEVLSNLIRFTDIKNRVILNDTHNSPVFWCVLGRNSYLIKALNLKQALKYISKVTGNKKYIYKKLNDITGMFAWSYSDGTVNMTIYRFCDDNVKKMMKIGGVM